MKKNDGGPAFPVIWQHVFPDKSASVSEHEGMSLRDLFAAAALIGVMLSPDRLKRDDQTCAGAAYEYADDMLKARKK